jgi:acyl-CoA reductase-like NAD-dependent aldehyde dehydrogenase
MNSIVENKLEILSPSDQTVIGSVTITNPESLDSYFSNARQAQKLWSQVPIKERCQYFYRLRDHLIDHAEEFAQAIAKENGKPAFEALAHEITPVIELITFYTKNTSSLLQEKRIPLHLMKHRKSILNYWPLGVVSVISPWNYPFLLPMGELVMALISGNAVIFKPSEITPLIGLKIQTLFEEAGFPKHLLTTVIGDGKLGSDIISHKPDKVFFTGSVATGKKIMAQAALNLTPVNLELGGKDPFIVLEDANLDYATSAALWGAFSNAGQICASVERILVHESIEKAFTQLYLEKIKKLRVGEDLGAITLPKQKQIYESQLNEAKAHHDRRREFRYHDRK